MILVKRVNLAEVAKAEKVALTEVTIVEKVTINTGFVLNLIYSIKIRLSAHAAKISDRFATGKALVLGYAILLSLSLSNLSVKLEPFSFLGPNTRPEILVILVPMDLENQIRNVVLWEGKLAKTLPYVKQIFDF